MAERCYIHGYTIFTVIALIFFGLLFLAGTYQQNRVRNLSERLDIFNIRRQHLLKRESDARLGSDIKFTFPEILIDFKITWEKIYDYVTIFENITEFELAQKMPTMQEELSNRTLFKMLRTMPKGAALHVHDTALCSVDNIVDFLSYQRHFWICAGHDQGDYVAGQFGKKQPQNLSMDCEWKLAKDLRFSEGNKTVDDKLRQRLNLTAYEPFKTAEEGYAALNSISQFIFGMVTYKRAWAQCFYLALKNYHDDGVQYMEIKTSLPELYDLNDHYYNFIDNALLLMIAEDRFRLRNPNFIGARLIYAPASHENGFDFDEYLNKTQILMNTYPEFIVGFDLENQVYESQSLKENALKLISLDSEIDFYLHAGLTNWFNTEIDTNLIDGVLLGAKRIGDGFALLKHPEVMRIIEKEDIPIEINPIARRVPLKLNNFRNHPSSILFATDFPIIISADDPLPMQVHDTPMTHDFYVTFVSIVQQRADLRTLKKLALNSLQYSGLDCEDKTEAMLRWGRLWDDWVMRILDESGNIN